MDGSVRGILISGSAACRFFDQQVTLLPNPLSPFVSSLNTLTPNHYFSLQQLQGFLLPSTRTDVGPLELDPPGLAPVQDARARLQDSCRLHSFL